MNRLRNLTSFASVCLMFVLTELAVIEKNPVDVAFAFGFFVLAVVLVH